jgi:hypothetical protein
MPHLMNCEHSETGWCLACVGGMHEALTQARSDADGALSALRTSEFERETAEGANILNRKALRHAKALCEQIEGYCFAANQSVLDDREPMRKEMFREIRRLAAQGIAGDWRSRELEMVEAERDAALAELETVRGGKARRTRPHPYRMLERFEERHGEYNALLDRATSAPNDRRAQALLRRHGELVWMCTGYSMAEARRSVQ